MMNLKLLWKNSIGGTTMTNNNKEIVIAEDQIEDIMRNNNLLKLLAILEFNEEIRQ